MDDMDLNLKIEAQIKQDSKDFIVEEISQNGTILKKDSIYTAQDLGFESKEGKFAIFVLQKENWNTMQALREISRRFRRGIKSVAFAGTKDRRSISTQLCSIYGVNASELSNINIKDIKINGSWQSDKQVELGYLTGNHFIIRLHANPNNVDNILKIHQALGGVFPNFFGSQRFGNRENNVDIGINIIKGNFESAVMQFLTDTNNENNQEALTARKRLKEELNYKTALSYFPSYLKYELKVIEYLNIHPGDYANALRRIPRQILLMFAHSVQSYIFNMEINERINQQQTHPNKNDLVCRPNDYGFPNINQTFMCEENGRTDVFLVGELVGYDSKQINDYQKSVLDSLFLDIQDFKAKRMPELNCKGKRRVMFSPYKDFNASTTDTSIIMEFSLPSGAYATSLLDKFINQKILLNDY